jgi:acetyl esterase/lipase
MSGCCIRPSWLPSYILTLATQHSAILISPDYRFLPESSGLDILSDLASLWSWVQISLQTFINTVYPSHSLVIDTSRILATGESAGGYLVVQAALSGMPGIRGIISAYPMLDLKARHFTQAYEKILTGAIMVDASVIDRHLKAMKEGEVVSKNVAQERLDLATAIIQQGRFVEFLGEEEELFPLERVVALGENEGGGTVLPRLWIYHGRQDTGVPASGSVKFVEVARNLWGEELRFNLPDGEHGLDKDCEIENTAWLRDGVEWVTEKWLALD